MRLNHCTDTKLMPILVKIARVNTITITNDNESNCKNNDTHTLHTFAYPINFHKH